MDIKSVLDERIICTELDAVDKEDALKKKMIKNAVGCRIYLMTLKDFMKMCY